VPIGVEEIKVIRTLTQNYIKVNCTCCYTDTQLELAAMAGAEYVSLFYNRAKDAGIDVIQTLARARNFIDRNGLDCKIIAGSIRKPEDIAEALEAGANIVTCSPKIIKEALRHEGTLSSIEGFMKDFEKWLVG
jgi:transaldolase